MRTLAECFLALVAACAAHAAALVPIPQLNFSVAHIEPNQGQAKPEVLFLSRGRSSLAVTAQSLIYAPLGARLAFVSGNPNPPLKFTDPLPGLVNSFTGAKSITGVARYSTATFSDVYPGIDFQFLMRLDGELTLRLMARPGASFAPVTFEIAKAVGLTVSNGVLVARLGPSRLDPQLSYLPPAASLGTAAFTVKSATQFGLELEGRDLALPTQIDLRIDTSTLGAPPAAAQTAQFADAAGNTFVAVSVADAAGNDAPFPSAKWEGCGAGPTLPIPCTDVAVHKFSKTGDPIWVTYLEGITSETPSFLRASPDGTLVLTGTTGSPDFPVTAGALQSAYAGPPATPVSQPAWGDFFAARLDPATGLLRTSTFFGGPGADTIGETALGPDGSLYFIPKWLVASHSGMPVSPAALQSTCPGDPCQNGYAAHLSANLDRLLYGTYLPGIVQSTARLHTDGSVYYAGSAGPGFPVTPTAYKKQPSGESDAIVARLDPTGAKLMFATYVGGPDTDWILRIAVAPDGSSWVRLSSFVQCCVNIDYRLIRFDAKGERILVDKPIATDDLAVDRDGNLIAMAYGNFKVSPDAFLGSACIGNYQAYVKLNPDGDQLFATYLPSGTEYDFTTAGPHGLPQLRIAGEVFEVVEGQDMGVFAGCVVDAAAFGNPDTISPGAIVTLFGSHMGPRDGVAFDLDNGRVPVSLGGTLVLVDGQPAPILYSSFWQLNVILPTSLQIHTRPTIQVVNSGSAGNELRSAVVQQAGLSLFRAVLNEDSTVNSPGNPAKKGSRVMLFGTGGGATDPPSEAGEVTPLAPRLLVNGARVEIPGGPQLAVEYAGTAPGLLAGVVQINVKLPDTIPAVAGFPRGTLPMQVSTPGVLFYSGYITIAVEPE